MSVTEIETGHDVSSERHGIKPLHMVTPTSGRCVVFMLEMYIVSHPMRVCDMRQGSESVTSPSLLWCKEDDMLSLNTDSSTQGVPNVESHNSVRVDSALDNDIFPILFSLAKLLQLKTYRRWMALRFDMVFGEGTTKIVLEVR